MNKIRFFQIIFSFLALIVIVAFIGATFADVVIRSLQLANELVQKYSFIVFLLPIIFLTTIFFDKKLKMISWPNHLSLLQKNKINLSSDSFFLKGSLFVFFGTFFSHLGGASVGREGSILQGATFLCLFVYRKLGSAIKFFNHFMREELIILLSLSAAFSSALGLHFAGAVFAIELSRQHKIPIKAHDYFAIILVSLLSKTFASMLLTSHWHFSIPTFHISSWDFCLSLAFGLSVGFLVYCFEYIRNIVKKNTYNKIEKIYSWRMAIILCSLVLAAIFLYLKEGEPLNGLGIDTIVRAFELHGELELPLGKLLITAYFLGLGFRGGEFTPLVFAGATWGSYMSQYAEGTSLGVVPILTSIGFILFYATSHRLLFTGFVVAYEMFSLEIAVLTFLALVISIATFRLLERNLQVSLNHTKEGP